MFDKCVTGFFSEKVNFVTLSIKYQRYIVAQVSYNGGARLCAIRGDSRSLISKKTAALANWHEY